MMYCGLHGMGHNRRVTGIDILTGFFFSDYSLVKHMDGNQGIDGFIFFLQRFNKRSLCTILH